MTGIHPLLRKAAAGIVLLFAWACASAQGIDAPGLVIDVQGSATVAGQGRIAILNGLAPGAEISLGPGARMVVVHSSSGRQFELSGPGAFRWTGAAIEIVRPGGLAVRDSSRAVFGGVRLRTARLAQASIGMRGTPSEEIAVRLVSPVSTWLLERPSAFRWEPVIGASGYRFELTDATGKTLYQARTADTAVQAGGSVAFEPGQTYGWQVKADLPGGLIAEGWTEFGVATRELRAKVEGARPSAGTSVGDRVLYGLLLEELGVREEAAEVWTKLAAERPDDAALRARAETR